MNKNAKRIISVVSVIAIVLGGFGIYSTFSKDKIASIVLLDVNPSIELRVDEDADVIEVVALNTDAEKVLKGMKLKGTDADTAVNAIIGSLLKHGYVDELANSILLSVEDKDKVRGAELQRELTEEINEILSATAINAAILAQQVDGVQVKEMADELDISKGKAELIQNIMEVNSSYKAEDLAKLSVNELNLVLSNPKNEVKNVTSTGNANEKAYIGKEVAKKKAYEHAKVKAEDIREAEVDFDYEYGKMVYEVEFSRGEYEYDYSIDAQEGTVLYSHREVDEDYVKVQESSNDSQVKEEVPDKQTSSSETSNNETKPTDIGKEKAKSVALKHAKTTESKVTRLIVEREYDDGKLEYHVDFRLGNKEYDYEISAETGEILDYDIDVDEDKTVTSSSDAKSSNDNTSKPTDIGEAKAKAIALEHAKTTEGKVTKLIVEREYDDGKLEYHVDFRLGNKEYDYEISAETGKILDYDIDVDEDKKVTGSSDAKSSNDNTSKPTDIGEAKAKAIALEHAKTTEGKVTKLIVEREYDDGKLEYHVDFRLGNKEYDYEISAETGEILDYDIDVDEDKKVASSSNNTSTEPADIGKEKAKSVALSHAGLKESQVTRLKVERDVDDGRIEYSVEFMASNKEYDYEINGENGEILDYDIEVEDND